MFSLFHPIKRPCGCMILSGVILAAVALPVQGTVQEKPRARDIGIPFDGIPGPYNAITDVEGVEVGHTTLISGEGRLEAGNGPVRTGVTAILPLGKKYQPVYAGWYSLNGNGEMTGTTWVEESGYLGGPIMITNTHSVGTVRDAVIKWLISDEISADISWSLPVVAETYDGFLNDINGFHVQDEHVFSALKSASSGPVTEGGVGGGTGMICHGFKGGIGTSSRVVDSYTIGVLVQANHGSRRYLMIAGAPIGKEINDLQPRRGRGSSREYNDDTGSIIVVVATNAPLLPHQLKRLARRVPMGIARVGGTASNGSGDIFITFSTGNAAAERRDDITIVRSLSNNRMSSLFSATIQATEEAIINALAAANDMTGINDNTVYALPHDRLIDIMKKYNRFTR
ncbi:P1 family peptidase [candidate division KSB1 bacterium]